MQNVAGEQGPPAMAAELPEREGRPAAEIGRHVEAPAHGEIGPRPAPVTVPSVSVSPAAMATGCQYGTARLSSFAAIGAPPRHTMASVLKRSVGPDSVISSAGAPSSLPRLRFARRKER